MSLSDYQRKRDFHKTPEPRGRKPKPAHKQLAFVVQKHDASHLHYDFRLEWDGVLKSWAVPKGPDVDPDHKRLAMQVEDHPLEYGGFEGVIPKGQYGGGTVLLWDKGVWEPVGDPSKGLKEGRLKFNLRGEKLQGGWVLVRRGGRKGAGDERHWFLFKERDEFARPGESIAEEKPLSVTTGRDLTEIADEADRVWGPSGEVARNGKKQEKRAQATRNGKTQHELLHHPRVRPARLPKTQAVELATLVDEAPNGADWLHEIKFDGYRMLCRIDRGAVRFISRNGRDWTKKFPELAEAAKSLPVKQAMVDGEVVALEPNGTSSFQMLQNIFRAGKTSELVYYAFDILYLDGKDVRGAPLELRKQLLKQLVVAAKHQAIRFSDHLEGTGQEILEHACRLHLEGIVSKRLGSPYQPGRGRDWLKVKCARREEFVIGGFTKPRRSRTHFGALLLGYYNGDGQLQYAGRVGTGFDEKRLSAVHRKLKALVQPESPFANLSGTTGAARGVFWVRPELVAEVAFSNWTDEGLLRHASFQGLRKDKPASEVILDQPIPVNDVTPSKNGHKPAAPRTRKADATDDEVAGVHLSHPDKILYPEQGITKRGLAEYYAAVAGWMLPHVADRPLALVRCPAGSGKPCFFQKHPGEGPSDYLHRVNISETAEPEYHMAVNDLAGLVSLVQMGVLEIHVWGARKSQLEKPDRLVFDLDPDPSVEWPQVVTAAREVRLVLEELGLASFLKTTGGKGLHLVVPVQPRVEWDEAKAFCRAVADFIAHAAPDRYVATMSKAARKGKIFIDYLRNGRGATAIAPYSTRSRPGATVSVPISWKELSPSLRSDHFTIETVLARLKQLKQDPWGDMFKARQAITAAMRKRLEVE